jgi:DNA modification methylase
VFSAPATRQHDGHPHAKPADWVRCLLANCTRGAIFSPFAGSGTSLIAAELLGRRWAGVEIDPGYCDVIVERWQEFTGGRAIRARQE